MDDILEQNAYKLLDWAAEFYQSLVNVKLPAEESEIFGDDENQGDEKEYSDSD